LAPKETLLEQMRRNPRSGWTIKDCETLCNQNGCELLPPTRGSHYKAVSKYLAGHETIPFHRPIKPFYIRSLVAMIDAHILWDKEKKGP